MRIAVSGAHRTGKTTLVAELHRLLPHLTVVDEPWSQLTDEGHEFAAPPTLEEFEMQLERAIETLTDAVDDRIFDRCPADLLAYLITHEDAASFDAEAWLPRARSAMAQLDLVVFVPIEDPDRIAVDAADEMESRHQVDEELRNLLFEDPWQLQVAVLEVHGPVRQRVQQVVAEIA